MNKNFDSNRAKAQYKKSNAPDFTKVISRDDMERIHGDKRTVIPFKVPKYGATWASKRELLFRTYCFSKI